MLRVYKDEFRDACLQPRVSHSQPCTVRTECAGICVCVMMMMMVMMMVMMMMMMMVMMMMVMMMVMMMMGLSGTHAAHSCQALALELWWCHSQALRQGTTPRRHPSNICLTLPIPFN